MKLFRSNSSSSGKRTSNGKLKQVNSYGNTILNGHATYEQLLLLLFVGIQCHRGVREISISESGQPWKSIVKIKRVSFDQEYILYVTRFVLLTHIFASNMYSELTYYIYWSPNCATVHYPHFSSRSQSLALTTETLSP